MGRKGWKPKFLWGRRNENYTAPEKADSGQTFGTPDLIVIAQDFHQVTDAAAKAAIRGDQEEYGRLVDKSAQIFAAYDKYEDLMGDVKMRVNKTEKWNEAYRQFREECGLDRERSENPILADESSYRGFGYSNDRLAETVDEIHIAAGEIRSANSRGYGGQDDQDAYQSAMDGSGPSHPSDFDKDQMTFDDIEADDSQTEQFPAQGESPETEASGNGGGEPPNNEGDIPAMGDDEPTPPEKSTRVENPRYAKKDKNGEGRGLFGSIEDKTGLNNHGSFRVTARPRVGPFIFNLGRRGLTSVSLAAGPMRYRIWSRKFKAGFSSMDLPSGLSFRGKQESR